MKWVSEASRFIKKTIWVFSTCIYQINCCAKCKVQVSSNTINGYGGTWKNIGLKSPTNSGTMQARLGKNYPPSSGQMESSHFTFTSIGTLKPRQGHGPISRSQNWGSPGHSLWKLGQSSMNQTFNSQRRQPGFPMGRTPPSWSNFCWGGRGA